MKILVVDDHSYNRELLSFILEDEGHACVEAENGRLACLAVEQDSEINLVLMDINMPEMDGIEATIQIKNDIGERFLPVIFVTALDDSEVVTRCLDAGGDDFVPKPVNENVLLAKINAHARSQSLYNGLQEANNRLIYHQKLMDREHAIVEHIFARGNARSKTTCDNLNIFTSPASMFDGDVTLSGAAPNGGVYLIVGDFTGHGLAAAMGSLPVIEVFFNLIERQASVSQIALELNTLLFELLPNNMFCCATIAHVERSGTSFTIWSGGMNDILCLGADGKALTRFESMHMPLGILSPAEFDDSPRMIKIEPGEKVYVYTDGVNEAANPAGEEFGNERLEEILLAGGSDVVSAITQAVNEFHEGIGQSDDMSIVQLTGGPLIHRSREVGEIVDVAADYHRAQSFPWEFSVLLEGDDLRSTSVVNQLMGFVSSINGIELHQDKIFTIVSELFSNALEHGVLELASSMKHTADGFEEYYQEREKRLATLSAGQFIRINLNYLCGEPNQIKLAISDSGNGFDYSNSMRKASLNDDLYGRGLSLLSSLCSTLEYSNGGSTAIAVYDLCREPFTHMEAI